MADIKTMTQEIAELAIDIEKSMMDVEYAEVVSLIKKKIEKLDELVVKVN